MSESIKHFSNEKSSPRSFGVLFSIVFLIIAFYPKLNSQDLMKAPLVVSFVFILLALAVPSALVIPNRIWYKFGLLLGSVIAPIVMMLVYFSTVLPTGLIMRLLGKDLLKKKLDKNAKSYWVKRTEPMGSMKNQF